MSQPDEPTADGQGTSNYSFDVATRTHEEAASNSNRLKSDARDSAHLQVRCPNCHATMDVAVDTAFTDLTCACCGSHFSLVDQSKATRMAPPISKMGRFELIERLGVGAYGSVWKARDQELDRTVAVKVPRRGVMTEAEQEKFFREARAAAQLGHPNIVSVHEVGRDGDSIYIVSDFVRGVTLGDWLTGQQITSREAAELCAKIADALDHAHEQGVVHRDLKPANIIIDGDGQPHLTDFGLARRDAGEVTVTLDGEVLGTPAYMSPEQARGEAHQADRRSDVYSLGVILFQLLTTELPFRGNARMVMHQVLHDEPPSPRTLNGNVGKDLETITLKCLEKDPNRRYRTAGELAEDLRRFLAGKPIHARPAPSVERAMRWVRRNPVVSALSSAVVVALVTGTIASALFAVDARRKADLARSQERAALAAKTEAEKERANAVKRQAEAERARAEETRARQSAEEVTSFLGKVLQSLDQNRDGPMVPVNEILNRASKELETAFPDQPLRKAALLFAMGKAQRNLNMTDGVKKAIPLFEATLATQREKLGREHADTLKSTSELARAYQFTGRSDLAIPLYETTIAVQREQLGTDHEETQALKRDLASAYAAAGRENDAIPLYEEVLAAELKNVNQEDYNFAAFFGSLLALTDAYPKAGRRDDVFKLYRETFATLGPNIGKEPWHADTGLLRAMEVFPFELYRDAGRADEAVDLMKEAVEWHRKKLKPEHYMTSVAMGRLAHAQLIAGQLDAAIRQGEETIAAMQKNNLLVGPHDWGNGSLNDLITAYRQAGRVDDALKLSLQYARYATALELSRDQPVVIVDQVVKSAIAQDLDAMTSAIDTAVVAELRLIAGHEESAYTAIRAARDLFDETKPYLQKTLGWSLLALGKPEQAKKPFERALAKRQNEDHTFNLDISDPDELTAAYFLDLIPEAEYVERLAGDGTYACFPWFYIAQRREIEGHSDAAIEAYQRCIDLGTDDKAHSVRALARWKMDRVASDHEPEKD